MYLFDQSLELRSYRIRFVIAPFCSQVKQLGNKSVSWIRRRDAHILTVDRYTFIADERFQAFLVEASDTWTLQVSIIRVLY